MRRIELVNLFIDLRIRADSLVYGRYVGAGKLGLMRPRTLFARKVDSIEGKGIERATFQKKELKKNVIYKEV